MKEEACRCQVFVASNLNDSIAQLEDAQLRLLGLIGGLIVASLNRLFSLASRPESCPYIRP